MLNRDQIAHEYAIQLIKKEGYVSVSSTVFTAFELAEAMIDEAEKRIDKERPSVLGDGWISVEDRLPEDKQEVLIYRPEAHLTPACHRNVIICEYSKEFGAFLDSAHEETHWQPLPSPPKP